MSLGTIRAVQIDLARQIETPETVYRFFDVAAAGGYNTVILYLEDRIKTPSYPFSEDAESYSTRQIAEMVAYAGKLSLELIPVVSNLGHTERFLRHEALRPLAERRGGIAGRFSPAGDTHYNEVCPSLKETYAFFDRYITEVASLFPSKYFHVGLDEFWDLGFCELCRPIVQSKGLSALFSAHIRHTHALLTSLGKTMMMWDDMFEECPESLNELPRDIVLCAWHYDYVDRRPAGHFNNLRREDSFAIYENLGISYLASTHSRLSNVESFTRYASMHRPLGMFLTIWEKEREQLLYLYPLIVQAGLLWQGIDADAPFERLVKAVRMVWPETGEGFARTAAAVLALPEWALGVRNLTNAIELPCGEAEELDMQRQALLSALAPYEGDAAAALRCRLTLPLLANRLHRLAYDLWEYRTGERTCDRDALLTALDTLSGNFEALYETQLGLWNRHRGGLAHPALDAQFDGIRRSISELQEAARTAEFGSEGRLDVVFCLPDQHGAPHTKICLFTYEGETVPVAAGSFKAAGLTRPFFTYSFRVPADTMPAAVTLSVSGYGGTGFSFLDMRTRQGRYIPFGVSAVAGQVERPADILTDDSRAAFLGEAEVQRAFTYPALARQESTLSLHLYKTLD